VPKIVFVLPDGERRMIDAESGTSIMRAAVNNLVPNIVAECGGEMSCATCHVFVEPEWFDRFPAVTPEERDMLEVTAAEPTEYSRLSCQLRCGDDTDGVSVHVPLEQ